jgi:hypothetical protein
MSISESQSATFRKRSSSFLHLQAQGTIQLRRPSILYMRTLQLTTLQTELAVMAKMGGIDPGGIHGILGSIQCWPHQSQPRPTQ